MSDRMMNTQAEDSSVRASFREDIKALSKHAIGMLFRVGRALHKVEKAAKETKAWAEKLLIEELGKNWGKTVQSNAKRVYKALPSVEFCERLTFSASACVELVAQTDKWPKARREALFTALSTAGGLTAQLVPDVMGVLNDPEQSKVVTSTIDGNWTVDGEATIRAAKAMAAARAQEELNTAKEKEEESAQDTTLTSEPPQTAPTPVAEPQIHPDTVKIGKIAAILQQGNLDAILVLEDALGLISQVVSIIEA